MSTEVKTGVDALRDALRVRMKKANLTNLVRDISDASKTPIGNAAVEAFATASANLPEPVLQALARHLFGDNASLDVERNLLMRKKVAPLPAAVGPPPIVDPKSLPSYHPVQPFGTLGPQPVVAERKQPRQARPGWAE